MTQVHSFATAPSGQEPQKADDPLRPGNVLRAFGTPDPVQATLAVALTWTGIIGTVWVGAHLDRWWLAPVALFILAGLQHRLFTIYHEAFHGTLFAHKGLNRLVGAWLAAYPMLSRYEVPRLRHLDHHKYATTPDDPEFVSDRTTWRSLLPLMFPWPAIAARLLGLAAPSTSPAEPNAKSATAKEWPAACQIVAVQGALLGLFWWIGCGYWALLYPAALLTVSPVLHILRQWVEHYNGDQPSCDPRYVIISPTWLERFFFAPMYFQFHSAHHRYPKVPFSNLPKVQRLLEEHGEPFLLRRGFVSLAFRSLRLR